MRQLKQVLILLFWVILLAVGSAGCGKESAETISHENSVTDTAYITLDWLTRAGNEDSARILEAVQYESILNNLEDGERLEPLNCLYQDIRYTSINDYILENHYENIMDVASGYSPRGIFAARNGLSYRGCDFADVCQHMSKIMARILSEKERENISYIETDATKLDTMLFAADTLEGEICITVEGLFMYLDREQIETVLSNIGEILHRHGGSFITTDFETENLVSELGDALYGDGEALYRECTHLYNTVSEGDMDNSQNDREFMETLLKELGLSLKKLPLGEDYQYDSANSDKEIREKVSSVMAQPYLWVITLSEV